MARSSPVPILQAETRRTLINALLDLPSIDSEAGRAVLTYDWPRTLRHRITMQGPPALVLETLVDVAARWEPLDQAPSPLLLLIEAARQQVAGTRLSEQLELVLATVITDLQRTDIIPPTTL